MKATGYLRILAISALIFNFIINEISAQTLEAELTNEGIIVPRVDHTTITGTEGQLIYDINSDSYWYHNGSLWKEIGSGAFERNGTTVRQVTGYDSDDFIFGRDSVPKAGEEVTGTFFFYNQNRYALIGGRVVNSKNWGPDSLGFASFGYGLDIRAKGSYSIAIGADAKALGSGGISMGRKTISSGASGATAIGNESKATGWFGSTALGHKTSATGFYGSTALGSECTANGRYGSTALGFRTESEADSGSTAMGYQTLSWGDACISTGIFNDPIISAGNKSKGLDIDSPIFLVGNGTSEMNRKNAFSVLNNGKISFENYSFPISDGTSKQILKTDGSGSLNWLDENWTEDNGDVYRTSGQVGIGTNDPDMKLHIVHANNSNNSGVKIENNSNANYWRLYTRSGSDELAFYNYDGSTEVLAANLTRSGTLSPSDRRLKEHVCALPYSKKDILKLDPKSYHFKESSDDRPSLGFIAQEVEELFPELVRYSADDDLYLMNYSGFGVLAIQAIKEQQKEIDALTQSNQELTSRVSQLEKLIEKIVQE